ncbi:type VI secretion system protein TssA [Enterobacter cloacae complex sp. ECC445]|uniref:type VI secretion system protein TssA n=1 Tax=Enterobacter cloacae complex TaxID=354276 RepID=UPI00097C532A|nr:MULTISPECIES: type VI secretion system protein TssA [Enterobacter cloacae complex]GJL42786.1 type VI secretion-associated protein [Enterobacter asburiae]MBT1935473.1 type VI secretion system protein TssA [Enterobacter chengduensis]MBT1963943.1 type VI secretion system protein TssA [Enterobacter chengduensis]MCG0457416.1 type VI secretion system protein TssA [Enterobacter cloacae complex sp. ECC445]MCK6820261.1 type VI secretion system protein TssA [Enterobacter chengduensis]
MTTAETLLTLCLPDEAQRAALIVHARDNLSRWDAWLAPLAAGNGAGDDPTYEDDFQLMHEEINKLSGTDTGLLCRLAELVVTHQARDIRVVTWYIFARLQREGDCGLADGLTLLVAMLKQARQHCHPLRSNARLTALEWLNSDKVLDAFSRWPDVTREDTARTAAALCLLEEALANLSDSERPSFAGLLRALETRLAGAGGLDTPVASSHQEETTGVGTSTFSGSAVPAAIAVKSEVELVRQLRVLSGWVVEQPQGWLAAHRMMKAARWDLVTQLPALDASGRTRLLPPKPDYRAQLKRLYLQQSWTELIEQVDVMFTEGGNRFWLDLQWYLWQGLSRAGAPWEHWADYVISDLKLMLKRLPGLDTLVWNDGTPLADEVTLGWIAEKVNNDMPGFADEPAMTIDGHAGDILSLETEAMEKGDSEGPEAALSWLQSRPGMDSPRSRWLLRLLMARVAEQYGRNELALHLLGELTGSAPQLTLSDWEPGLLFDVQARRLRLLRLKAGRSESDKVRLAPEMDTLLAGLIALDPARAMVLCG